jgi:FAD dependent oxidoreductase./Rieske [2Fe-2S] domain.
MDSEKTGNPESFWLEEWNQPPFPPLATDISMDVAVIGGGIAGITTAYLLMREGIDVLLLDADRLLHGTTGHTTAKVTSQHGLFYKELIDSFGSEKARQYFEANEQAKEFIQETVAALNIECDLLQETAYVYAQSTESLKKLEEEWKAYEKLGIPGFWTDETALPFPVGAAIGIKNQACFHPIKYLRALVDELKAGGVPIYEGTTAFQIENEGKTRVLLQNGGKITCQKVVICTHFPFHDQGFYFARMNPERSYVIAVMAEKGLTEGMYINAGEPTRSIRRATCSRGDMLLISGDHHKTGQGIPTHKHYENLIDFARNTFGIREILYRWSAQDWTTLDKVPYIGPITADNPNLYVATGFRKWGMTHGTLAGLMFRDYILRRENPYQDLYSPSRIPKAGAVKNFIQTNLNVAGQLIKGKLEISTKSIADLKPKEGAILTMDGKRRGAYKDETGNVYVVDTTCTHMGCEVQWNSGENTWDCPCHGSRFRYTGEVIEGPADRPLERAEPAGD